MNCTQEFVPRIFIFTVPEDQIGTYSIWYTFCVAVRICTNVNMFLMAFWEMAVSRLQVAK